MSLVPSVAWLMMNDGFSIHTQYMNIPMPLGLSNYSVNTGEEIYSLCVAKSLTAY